MRVLYEFPISHYCEKVRWALDAKRLAYERRAIVPGLHRRTVKKLVGRSGPVPVLVDGDERMGDSTAIVLYLERAYPAPPLVPQEETARARVLSLEEWFDEHAGPHVRRWMYGQLLAQPGFASRAIARSYPFYVKALVRLASRRLEGLLRKQYAITPDNIEASRRAIFEVLDRIEAETQGNENRMLAGDALSVADITAASLLAPLVAPAGSPWDAGVSLVPNIAELREEVRARPAGLWVLARYARDRSFSPVSN